MFSTEEFVIKARLIHGDRYNYSKVDYCHSQIKVQIICPIHGVFFQRPSLHLQGNGCVSCRNEKFNTQRKNSVSDFIKKAKDIHKNKYDYSLVEYINNKTKVKIICPIHGVFEQKPNNHINLKQGCMQCRDDVNRLNLNEVIERSNKIHNNKYNYDLVVYENNNSKVKIVCPKHGVFTQRISDHMLGRGCRLCKFSLGEKTIADFLMTNNIKFIPQKTFDDCKNTNVLPFDFYLPEYKICIEYQGEQHFKEIKKWGGKSKLDYTHHNDNIKKNYCKINDINFIEISYNDNIEEKLLTLKKFIYNCTRGENNDAHKVL